ncbi:hypothetical protein PCE1_004725 [Barthelona sp. PCE]
MKDLTHFFGAGAKKKSSKTKKKKRKVSKSRTVSSNPTKVAKTNPKAEVSIDPSIDLYEDKTPEQKQQIAGRLLSIMDIKPWGCFESMPFSALAKCLDVVGSTTKRLEKAEYLSNFFQSVLLINPADLSPCLYFMLLQLYPTFHGVELGVGETQIIQCVAQATGKKVKQVREKLRHGDIGDAVEHLKMGKTLSAYFQKKKTTLSVINVIDKFRTIAGTSGSNSQRTKMDMIVGMLVSCSTVEAKFIARFVRGRLRIGISSRTIFPCLSAAVNLKNETLMKAWCVYPVVERITSVIFDNFKNLTDELIAKEIQFDIGVPCHPMLAESSKAIEEIFKRFEGKEFVCEFKYDGERGQIHYKKGEYLRIFSRNLEDLSDKYPKLRDNLPLILSDEVESIVIDCEIVAHDEDGKMMRFQDLQRRGRKDTKAREYGAEHDVVLYCFDLMYYNGKHYLDECLAERQDVLHRVVDPTKKEGIARFAESRRCDDWEQVSEFFDTSRSAGTEGLMIKSLYDDANYTPDKRSFAWRKLKKDYIEGCGDTLDLVPVGALGGTGKRAKKLGSYLMAAYDEEKECYISMFKFGSGLTDDLIDQFHNYYMPRVLDKRPPDVMAEVPVEAKMRGFHWLEPSQVWEISVADLTISPLYRVAYNRVEPNRGISCRFPRFKCVREDKGIEDATSCERILRMYNSQDQIKNAKSEMDDEIDEDLI